MIISFFLLAGGIATVTGVWVVAMCYQIARSRSISWEPYAFGFYQIPYILPEPSNIPAQTSETAIDAM